MFVYVKWCFVFRRRSSISFITSKNQVRVNKGIEVEKALDDGASPYNLVRIKISVIIKYVIMFKTLCYVNSCVWVKFVSLHMGQVWLTQTSP